MYKNNFLLINILFFFISDKYDKIKELFYLKHNLNNIISALNINVNKNIMYKNNQDFSYFFIYGH